MADLLVGRYERVASLGRGAMGEVWLANDRILGRQVAIKRIITDPSTGLDHHAVERIVREARVAARIQHPNVVAVFDLITEDGQPYVVMEYVHGQTLAERIRRVGRLSPAEVAPIVGGLAAALETAHRAGIIHRDIKPANVMIDDAGQAKLADFGIARGLGDGSLTETGSVLGTIAYMAPEVARGKDATPATDIYSLGATLYAAVEGYPPFGRPGEKLNTATMLVKLVTEDVPEPANSGMLTPLLTQMLATDPTQRPTAGEIQRGVGVLMAAQPQPVLEPSPVDEAVEDDSVGADDPGAATSAPEAGLTGPAAATRRRSDLALTDLHAPVAVAEPPVAELPAEPVADVAADTDVPAPLEPAAEDELDATRRRVDLALTGPVDPAASVSDTRPAAAQSRASGAASRRKRKRLIVGLSAAVVVAAAAVVAVVVADRGPRGARLVGTIAMKGEAEAIAVSPNGSVAYAAGSNGRTVSVIDLASSEVVDSVTVGKNPFGVAFAPDGKVAYVTNGASGTVSVIDVASREVADAIIVGDTPDGVAFAPDGKVAYVANANGTVSVIDVASREVADAINVGDAPIDVAFAPGGKVAYVTNDDGTVSVIDVASREVADTINVGDTPDGVAFAPDGKVAYVTNADDGTVSVIDVASREVADTINVGDTPDGVAFAPDGKVAYVANANGTVSVIDVASREVADTINVGDTPRSVEFAPDGKRAYVANQSSKTVSVIDTGL